jgi:hypothetical protein
MIDFRDEFFYSMEDDLESSFIIVSSRDDLAKEMQSAAAAVHVATASDEYDHVHQAEVVVAGTITASTTATTTMPSLSRRNEVNLLVSGYAYFAPHIQRQLEEHERQEMILGLLNDLLDKMLTEQIKSSVIGEIELAEKEKLYVEFNRIQLELEEAERAELYLRMLQEQMMTQVKDMQTTTPSDEDEEDGPLLIAEFEKQQAEKEQQAREEMQLELELRSLLF